jgi:membrane associated rhomboid family serine protease
VDVGNATTGGHAEVSAQCPACGLHELIVVHLESTEEGAWTQVEEPSGNQVVQIDACPVCNGAWFDAGELDTLAGEEGAMEDVLDPGSVQGERPCPHGHGPMKEHRLPGRVETPLDRCGTCGGLWLDGDERRNLAKTTTAEGQQSTKEKLIKRGAIYAAQLLTQLPVEVENPMRGTPWVVFGLLATLFSVFILQIYGYIDTYDNGLVAGRLLASGDWYTLATHQFLHGSWVHLLGNAYFLYTFGDNIEHVFGRKRFFAFFVLAGVAGGAMHVLLTNSTALPVVGASGAIAGVLAAYLWTFPKAKLFHVIFFVQLKLPVWVYLFVWVGFHLFMAFFTWKNEVAWFAHLGGFLLGITATPVLHWIRRREIAKSVRVPAW